MSVVLSRLEGKEEKSRAVCRAFIENEMVKNAKNIALFISMLTEPDTTELFLSLRRAGKKTYAPRIVPDGMEFVEVTEKTVFTVGAFGIKEPQGDAYEGGFDVMAVPLVAFDEKNARLGHGKGYYDGFLKKHPCYTIGLAFSVQKKDVPVDPWDVPLNEIVTDQNSK